MGKTVRYAMYILITGICIVSIFIGIYEQFFKVVETPKKVDILSSIQISEQEDIKEKYTKLFDSKVPSFENVYNVPKVDQTKDYLYIFSNDEKKPNGPFVDKVQGKYDIIVYLPILNIETDAAQNINNKISESFVKFINEKMERPTVFTTINGTFSASVYENVLSVTLMVRVKEEGKSQRLMVQGYSYDLKKHKEITIKDLIVKYTLNRDEINKKIRNVVAHSKEITDSITQTGTGVYERDLNNSVYYLDNVRNFTVAPSGKIYIIYAYGNDQNTSEIDIIPIN